MPQIPQMRLNPFYVTKTRKAGGTLAQHKLETRYAANSFVARRKTHFVKRDNSYSATIWAPMNVEVVTTSIRRKVLLVIHAASMDVGR